MFSHDTYCFPKTGLIYYHQLILTLDGEKKSITHILSTLGNMSSDTKPEESSNHVEKSHNIKSSIDGNTTELDYNDNRHEPEPSSGKGALDKKIATDTEPGLELLETWSMDQDQLERNVAREANKAMAERDIELDEKRLTKVLNNKQHHQQTIRRLQQKLKSRNIRISEKKKVRAEIKKIETEDIQALDNDIRDIKSRIRDRQKTQDGQQNETSTDALSTVGNRNPDESQHDYLVRTGKITPFSNTFMVNPNLKNVVNIDDRSEMSHQQLRLPGMELDELSDVDEEENINENEYTLSGRIVKKRKRNDSDFELSEDDDDDEIDNDDDYELSDTETIKVKKRPSKSSKKKKQVHSDGLESIEGIDDGDIRIYKSRLNRWLQKRIQYREKIYLKQGVKDRKVDHTKQEWQKPHPLYKDFELDDQFKMPGDIYKSLFDYQKTGVQWQWELYTQNVGGILSDEMGLGKTIQIVAFIAGLMYSGLLEKPALVVCPATVMKQWVNEFHRWWPALRVVILHSIGSGIDLKHEERLEEMLDDSENQEVSLGRFRRLNNAQTMINNVMKTGMIFFSLIRFYYL